MRDDLASSMVVVIHAATSAVEACRGAGATLIGSQPVVTAGFEGAPALRIGEARYGVGGARCLAAARPGVVVEVPGVGAEDRWPAYRAAAHAERVARTGELLS